MSMRPRTGHNRALVDRVRRDLDRKKPCRRDILRSRKDSSTFATILCTPFIIVESIPQGEPEAKLVGQFEVASGHNSREGGKKKTKNPPPPPPTVIVGPNLNLMMTSMPTIRGVHRRPFCTIAACPRHSDRGTSLAPCLIESVGTSS